MSFDALWLASPSRDMEDASHESVVPKCGGIVTVCLRTLWAAVSVSTSNNIFDIRISLANVQSSSYCGS